MNEANITATVAFSDADCWPELFRRFWQGRHADSQGRISAGPTVREGFRQYVAEILLESLLTVDERRSVWTKSEQLLAKIKKRSGTQDRIYPGRVDVMILELQLRIDEPVPRT